MSKTTTKDRKKAIKTPSKKANLKCLQEAFRLMATAKAMAETYEANAKLASKYVHATSRGHEAIQLALGMQLQAQDYVCLLYTSPSPRDRG